MKKIDLTIFEEVLPEDTRPLALSCRLDGKVSLSSALHEEITSRGWQNVMFAANPKGGMVLMRQATEEERSYSVPKTTYISAPAFTKAVQKRGVKLPARYVVEWSDEHDLWVGMKDNTPQSRPQKNGPDAQELV